MKTKQHIKIKKKGGTMEESPQPVKQVVHAITSMVSPRYLDLTFLRLFWIFVVGSIFGLVIEDVFHLIVYHEWESRAGLVWGPFSPLYGVGAVVLTVFLNRFYYTHNLIIFIIAMILGSAMEYLASLMMEVFWHAIAWDYTGTFGSIDGRTNFFFGVIFNHIDFDNTMVRIVSVALVAFMTVDIAITILALHREGQRTGDIPPANVIDVWLDNTFTDEWLQQRFENMTVSSDIGTPEPPPKTIPESEVDLPPVGSQP
jgi:hypothetical protein